MHGPGMGQTDGQAADQDARVCPGMGQGAGQAGLRRPQGSVTKSRLRAGFVHI